MSTRHSVLVMPQSSPATPGINVEIEDAHLDKSIEIQTELDLRVKSDLLSLSLR
jgi:hypothetical protein